MTALPEEAADFARPLVEERLAACVNRPDCRFTYRWEGAVEEDSEAVLPAKTTNGAYDALVERVEELHPYEAPPPVSSALRRASARRRSTSGETVPSIS